MKNVTVNLPQIILVLSALTFGGPASAFGDKVEGRKIAAQWCATCHVVQSGQTSGTTDAPPFREIKKRHQANMDFLQSFLTQDHPQMPNMSLTKQEIENLQAYIGSL